MLELVVFLALGVVLGVIIGLVPGIHPNMIILILPILYVIDISPINVLSFIVALGVTNSVVDFIPSILLGAPEPGKELSSLPGHKLLLKGYGYDAIKLCVIGSIGGTIVVSVIFPFLLVSVPFLYSHINNYIYVLLVFIVCLMVLSENGWKKITALSIFLLSGMIGLLSDKLPINNNLVLFPILSGFFGVSMLLLQLKSKTKISHQRENSLQVSQKTVNRSIVFGAIGGVFSGFLPGVGSSEIATLASVDKNEKSFLLTIGSITTSNILLSIMSLYLIGKSRSGLAVVIDQTLKITLHEILLVIVVALISVGIASVITLKISRISMKYMEKINYNILGVCVVLFIALLTVLFTGVIGLFLLVVCTSLGILANIINVKRGNLMGILILPTILFYALTV